MIASAGMTYALKFLWAPLLDHWKLPLFNRLGRRRGWLLFAQIGVVVCLLIMVWSTPENLGVFIPATLGVAFFGATQDIAVDAYRIEIAPLEAQGALVATYSLGYRFGLLMSFALAATLADHIPWPRVYLLMAAAMLIPIVANLIAREPDAHPAKPKKWRNALEYSVIDPFVDFFRRYGLVIGGLTLLFILIYKIPEQATIGGIMSPFYLDMGFTQTQIGVTTKVYGVIVGIIGTFLGGAAVARWGVWWPLLGAIVACGCSNLGYLMLLGHHGDMAVFAIVILLENSTLGFLGSADRGVSFIAGEPRAHGDAIFVVVVARQRHRQGARHLRGQHRHRNRLCEFFHHYRAAGAARRAARRAAVEAVQQTPRRDVK